MAQINNADEIEQRWPEAVDLARRLRAVFGDKEVHLMFAWSATNGELKRRGWAVLDSTKILIRSSTHGQMNTLGATL